MKHIIIIIEPERVQGPDVALVVTVERHVLAACTSVQIPARRTHNTTKKQITAHSLAILDRVVLAGFSHELRVERVVPLCAAAVDLDPIEPTHLNFS